MKEKINEEYRIHITFCLHWCAWMLLERKSLGPYSSSTLYSFICKPTLLQPPPPSLHTLTTKRLIFERIKKLPEDLLLSINVGVKHETSSRSKLYRRNNHCWPLMIPGYDLPNRPRTSRVLLCQQSAGTLRRHGRLQGPTRDTVASVIETPRLLAGCCQGSYNR